MLLDSLNTKVDCHHKVLQSWNTQRLPLRVKSCPVLGCESWSDSIVNKTFNLVADLNTAFVGLSIVYRPT